jgi:hypothetical protein
VLQPFDRVQSEMECDDPDAEAGAPHLGDQRAARIEASRAAETVQTTIEDPPRLSNEHRVLHSSAERRPGIAGGLHAHRLRETTTA